MSLWVILLTIGPGCQDARSESIQETLRAAEQGDPAAQFKVAALYQFGDGFEKDEKTAFLWLRKAAAQGLADAQVEMGFCFSEGRQVGQDHQQAVRWYRLAAEQGHPIAMCNLGIKYSKGQGVSPAPDKAMRWLFRSAKQGYPYACRCIAIQYLCGIDVEVDLKHSAAWYEKAANLGDAESQNALGLAYATATGVKLDLQRSRRWFLLAAQQGDAEHQYNTGVFCLQQGDHAGAIRWFEESANQGNHQAHFNLGVMHGTGAGLAVNPEISLMHLQTAAILGNSQAIEVIVGMAKKYRRQPSSTASELTDLTHTDANHTVVKRIEEVYPLDRPWYAPTLFAGPQTIPQQSTSSAELNKEATFQPASNWERHFYKAHTGPGSSDLGSQWAAKAVHWAGRVQNAGQPPSVSQIRDLLTELKVARDHRQQILRDLGREAIYGAPVSWNDSQRASVRQSAIEHTLAMMVQHHRRDLMPAIAQLANDADVGPIARAWGRVINAMPD